MSDAGIPSIGPVAPSQMIEVWGEALERKDPGTWSHCQRVAVFAKILAQALGLEKKDIRVITDGARALAAARTGILRWSGNQFDPHVIEVFLSVRDDTIAEGMFSAR